MTDTAKCFSDILDAIRARELVIFCGAGISMNSGIPNASQIKGFLVKRMFRGIARSATTRMAERLILKCDLPFEYFLELFFASYRSPEQVLNIFGHGEPNTNHYFVSRLAAHRFIAALYTTNFDTLIERSLDTACAVRHTESEMADLASTDTFTVYKLHGCISDPPSIRTTISSIAQRRLSEKRARLLKHVFHTGAHRCVLIMGYSCSDHFDINPVLASLKGSNKVIYLVNHTRTCRASVAPVASKYPFQRFRGSVISVNTDSFVRKLWLGLKLPAVRKRGRRVSTPQLALDKWKRSIETANQNAILGDILFRMAEYRRALTFFKAALDTARTNKETAQVARYELNIANCLQMTANFNESIVHYAKAIRIFRRLNQADRVAVCHIEIANLYDGWCKYQLSLRHYRRGIVILKRMGDKKLLSWAHMNVCNPYFNLGQYRDVVRHQSMSLRMLRAVGDKFNEAHGEINLGKAYWRLGNLQKALNHLKASLKIFRDLADRQNEANALMNIGVILIEKKQYERELAFQHQALPLFEALDDALGMAHVNNNVAEVCHRTGDYPAALKHIGKARSLYESVSNHSWVAACFESEGDILRDMNKPAKARERWRRAKSIYGKTMQKRESRRVERKLALRERTDE